MSDEEMLKRLCGYTDDEGTFCQRKAVWHIRWQREDLTNGTSCNEHIDEAMLHKPFMFHPIVEVCWLDNYWIADLIGSYCAEEPVTSYD